MPTQSDSPIGVGATNGWGLYGPLATDKLQAVRSNDGDSSVIYGVSGGRLTRQLYTFPLLADVTSPVTAASVSFSAKKYANGGGAQCFYGVWNSVRMANNRFGLLNSNSYVSTGDSASGSGLDLAAVNGQHGVEVTAAGGPRNPVEVWVTHLYRTVTFEFAATSGAGDFAYLIGSLVGALLGSNVLLRDMPGIARAMARTWRGGRNVRLLDHELEPAWRAWRAFRHPVYSR